jgi:hypothetical protein
MRDMPAGGEFYKVIKDIIKYFLSAVWSDPLPTIELCRSLPRPAPDPSSEKDSSGS